MSPSPPSCGHRAGDRSGVTAARGLRPPSPAERAGPERIPVQGAGSRAGPGLGGLLPAAPGRPRPRQRGDTRDVVSGEPPAPSVAPSGLAAGPGAELPWPRVPRGAGGARSQALAALPSPCRGPAPGCPGNPGVRLPPQRLPCSAMWCGGEGEAQIPLPNSLAENTPQMTTRTALFLLTWQQLQLSPRHTKWGTSERKRG